MKESEGRVFDSVVVRRLTALVSTGESANLEFKRKAATPEKIVKEMIAFANTNGGVLLVGVDDNGQLLGLRYPEEEALVVRKALQKHCRPSLEFDELIVPLSAKKAILRYDIPLSQRRPHHFRISSRVRETYIRVKDMSMKASLEMTEIVRMGKQNKNIQFTYGAPESSLMRYLDDHPSITLKEFQALCGLEPSVASRKLVTLVLANVIRITPTEKGDLYSRK